MINIVLNETHVSNFDNNVLISANDNELFLYDAYSATHYVPSHPALLKRSGNSITLEQQLSLYIFNRLSFNEGL